MNWLHTVMSLKEAIEVKDIASLREAIAERKKLAFLCMRPTSLFRKKIEDTQKAAKESMAALASH